MQPRYAALYLSARSASARAAPYKRAEVMARWGFACAYCDAPAEHLDHIKPIARGGLDELRNVIPTCALCNLAKADMTLAQWAASWQSTH